MPDNNGLMLSLQVSKAVISKCGFMAAALFARLWFFTGGGKHSCFYTDKSAMSELDLGMRTLHRALDRLKASGLITVAIERTNYGRRKSYSIDLAAYRDMCKSHICSKRTYVPNAQTHMSDTHRPICADRTDRDQKGDQSGDQKGCVPHPPDGGAGTHSDPPSAPSQEQVEKAVAAYVRSPECRKPPHWKTDEAVKVMAVTVLNNIVQKKVQVRNLDLYAKNAVETWKGIERAMAPKPKARKAGGRDAGGSFGSIGGGELRGSMEEATESAMDAIQIIERSRNGGGGSLPKLAAAQAGTGKFLL